MNLIRIINWDGYENNRTRSLKRMDWVPVPNKMDGDGYTELLDHPNGAAHYGAWMALLLIASKCEVRGTLTRNSKGQPHTSDSLSRISRIPLVIFNEVLPRLTSIGWISMVNEVLTEELSKSSISPHDDAGERLRAQRALPFHSVPFPSVPFNPSEVFESDFWPFYWRKVDKADALRAFQKHASAEPIADAICAAVKAHAPSYLRRNPEHRPHASTWLNKLRWQEKSPDELEAADPPTPPPSRGGRGTPTPAQRVRKVGDLASQKPQGEWGPAELADFDRWLATLEPGHEVQVPSTAEREAILRKGRGP